ncbi:MAG TPA: hemerythrin family protein [Nitrospirota bacterium]|nr:hemerythrin family protein [Nitrospirota bacterium]
MSVTTAAATREKSLCGFLALLLAVCRFDDEIAMSYSMENYKAIPMSFKWNDELNTGISNIDIQHKQLFTRFNALLQACNTAQEKDAVGNYLNFLHEYIIFHFEAEEREMINHKYPRCDEHKAEHETFKKQINQLYEGYTTHGVNMQVFVMTIRTSGEWLVNHILKTDKVMAEYLRNEVGTGSGA